MLHPTNTELINGPEVQRMPTCTSPVKMFLSSRQAGYSNRQQRPNCKGLQPEYKSDKCEVSSRYFVVGRQMAGRRYILTGLHAQLCCKRNHLGKFTYILCRHNKIVCTKLNYIDSLGFPPKCISWTLSRFSGWLWAKLAPIYSKGHLKYDSMPFVPLALHFKTFLLRHAQKSFFSFLIFLLQ